MDQHTLSIPNEVTIERIQQESAQFQLLKRTIGSVIVGNEDIIQHILIALLCNGHVLLEGVPGVAKTTLIKSIAKAIGLSFKRIQFTPDLLPSDLIGTLIFNQKTQEFETKKGPIFANLILADEINRAPAKVQSALLEAMQEQQVTIGSQTFALGKPFLIFATQNSIEQTGTYPLPEAQVDRFMFKLHMKHPTPIQEKEVIYRAAQPATIDAVINQQAIIAAQELTKQIYVDEKIVDYIVNIIVATRQPEQFKLNSIKSCVLYGVSPRATLALYHASQAYALLKKRHFVIPDDVKAVAPAVLQHRITRTFEAEADNISTLDIIATILATIPTP